MALELLEAGKRAQRVEIIVQDRNLHPPLSPTMRGARRSAQNQTPNSFPLIRIELEAAAHSNWRSAADCGVPPQWRPITDTAGCCACAARGHAAAPPCAPQTPDGGRHQP
jgi:hypothetical protein